LFIGTLPVPAFSYRTKTVSQPTPKTNPSQPLFEVITSRLFLSWLAQARLSIAVTTYQSGKIFFLGLKADGSLSVHERTLERVMGMAVDDQSLYLSTLYQVWRFRNMLEPGQDFQGHDALYIPRESHVTGDIDAHDMAVDSEGRLVFVNTLFNCLATLDDQYSFRPIWKPSWISRLAPEDRCHLNGLTLRDGKPRYVTAVSQSDVADGWRDKRRGSGVVCDIQSNTIICENLSMPHSPRWHDGRLWLLNSGTGYFGYVDLSSGKFKPVTFCPGYARGLAITGDWAIIGLSDRRENRTFQDLPLEDNLRKHDAETRCGLLVVNLKTGEAPHWVRFQGVVRELYDVAVLPGVIRPMAVGFKSDEIRHYVSVPPENF
jgi:uncharacterized protein (TIGR03032 family)